jgi:UDP-N-acetylenolpyruvoylglucosamine reductase
MSQKIHFVGIGGSGISGVAALAERSGFTVTGCDLEESSAYGTHIVKGHSPSHIKDTELVITSPALFYAQGKNPEIEAARKTGKLMTWQKFVSEQLTGNKKVICIAGTHGKSTTTAMAGKMLTDAGLDPMVVIGANVPEWGGNSRYGEGKYLIIEADEFNDNFLNYHPDIIVLTNIEFDHPDYFKDERHVRNSFDKFIKNLKGEKILITQKDSVNKKFNLKVFGEHNQSNANLVFALGRKLGIKDDEIVRSLKDFAGLGRRMELIADRSGVKFFDDYAHHPTAIKTTIGGLRAEFPASRIWAINEPHGYKRTKALLKNYEGVFDSADKVIIGPIFKARDMEDKTITPQIVAESARHKDAIGLETFDEIKKKVRENLKEGDIVLVMGAGKSYLWTKELADEFPVMFSDLTTLRVGGKIKKYFTVRTKNEIQEALKYAKTNNLPVFVIGGGSDILVSDSDFNGVVVKYTGDEHSLTSRTENSETIIDIKAQGGMNWDRLVEYAVSRNLQGIECLSGIPGTVGAAPIQNIGAYGQELKDTFVSLTAYDIEKEKYVIFTNKDCKFGYRESIFKNKKYWQKYIIVSVTLRLKYADPEVGYESLISYITEQGIKDPTLKEVRRAVLKIRSGKFEDPKKVGNAGSFFKNPVLEKSEFEKIIKKHPDLGYFETVGKYKVFAGWLIDKAGWKGKTYKTAGVSPNHALILINPEGRATASDILELSEKIIADVYDKFDIKLEREVQLINF